MLHVISPFHLCIVSIKAKGEEKWKKERKATSLDLEQYSFIMPYANNQVFSMADEHKISGRPHP